MSSSSSELIHLLKIEIEKYEAVREELRAELALLRAIRATQEEEKTEEKNDEKTERTKTTSNV